MRILPELKELHSEMTEWRHRIHKHPETAFEEYETSDFVAEKLESFGIEVHRGLAKTGVVGTLKNGSGNRRKQRILTERCGLSSSPQRKMWLADGL